MYYYYKEVLRLKEEIEKLEQIKGFEEVKEMNFDDEKRVIDSFGNHWVKCEVCGNVKRDTVFARYGGPGKTNIGICRECYIKSERERCQG